VRSIDIIVPAFNEQECLRPFFERLRPVLDALPYRTRVLFVDDGSSDGTSRVALDLSTSDRRVGLLRLSRNFGHQAALTAGLDASDADAVITMDADLQHPPEMLPAFVARWQEGFELVSGVRAQPARVSAWKRSTSALFYRLLNTISPLPITPDSPDFRLLDRKVVNAIRTLREQSRFLRGMYSWVGFRQCQVRYEEGDRAGGDSHYSTLDMILFALSAVLSFSRVPLRLATYVGLIVAGLSFAYGVYAIAMNVVFHQVIRGWTSLAVLMSFLSGVQLLTLGVIGEYLGQVLDETKRRPLYLVAEVHVPEGAANDEAR
jgi:glycosyltransferase involved in cell wall biosynthesis